jgi:hypothetical protein
MASFDSHEPRLLDSKSFAEALRANATNVVCASYSVKYIQRELDRVSNWFTSGGTFYDESGNIISISGAPVMPASPTTNNHMLGKSNPKTGKAYTADELKQQTQQVQCHNLLHNSQVDRETLSGLSFPEGKTSLQQFTVVEMKKMIFNRGGQVTGRDEKSMRADELRRELRAYMMLQDVNSMHRVYFDRDHSTNGIFAKIDTGRGQSIGDILNNLVNSREHRQADHKLFVEVHSLLSEGRFIEDFDMIAIEAPDLSEDFIKSSFIHIGDNEKQKNIRTALWKVIEMESVLYHSFAWGPDKTSIYVLSKQVASQKRDEKTRKHTDAGEKPLSEEYLVLAKI